MNRLICAVRAPRRSLAIALLGVLGILASESYAGTAFSGTVGMSGTYGDGSFFFVVVTSPINEPGCTTGQARIDIQAGSERMRVIMSVVLTAKALGKVVQGSVNGCYNGFPTLDNSHSSYVYISD